MAGAWLRDRANREEETERAVIATLVEADWLQKQQKVPDALAKVKQAQAILSSGARTPALEDRVLTRLVDLKLVADLEDIRFQRVEEWKNGGFFDGAKSNQRYAQAFRAFGIDVEGLPPDQAASLIRNRSVRVELAAALDDWYMAVKRQKPVDDARLKRLMEVARAADPDELRTKVRRALEQRDPIGLVELQE